MNTLAIPKHMVLHVQLRVKSIMYSFITINSIQMIHMILIINITGLIMRSLYVMTTILWL